MEGGFKELVEIRCRSCTGTGFHYATEQDPNNPSSKKRYKYICNQCNGHGTVFKNRVEKEVE